MNLWEMQTEKEIRLHQAVDELQHKFGKKALQRGKMPQKNIDLLLSGAYWVLPNQFMAGPFPTSYQVDGTQEIIETLLALGVRQFIDLTEKHEHQLDHYLPVLKEIAGKKNLPVHYQRFPILDHGIPSISVMAGILDKIDASLSSKSPVYVHCWGGIGRTGTVVGCWLVRHGRTGAEALGCIKELRKTNPGMYDFSPETTEQRTFVMQWKEKAS